MVRSFHALLDRPGIVRGVWERGARLLRGFSPVGGCDLDVRALDLCVFPRVVRSCVSAGWVVPGREGLAPSTSRSCPCWLVSAKLLLVNADSVPRRLGDPPCRSCGSWVGTPSTVSEIAIWGMLLRNGIEQIVVCRHGPVSWWLGSSSRSLAASWMGPQSCRSHQWEDL